MDIEKPRSGMTETIQIRMYNVGLSDCILVSTPWRRDSVHLLIDFGSNRGKDRMYLFQHTQERIWEYQIETFCIDFKK